MMIGIFLIGRYYQKAYKMTFKGEICIDSSIFDAISKIPGRPKDVNFNH